MTEPLPPELALVLTECDARFERRLARQTRRSWLMLGLMALIAVSIQLWSALFTAAIGAGSVPLSIWSGRERRRRRMAPIDRALRETPEDVGEIAWRPNGFTVLVLADGTRAALEVDPARVEIVVDSLAARCPRAYVHAGRPARHARVAPTARLLPPK